MDPHHEVGHPAQVLQGGTGRLADADQRLRVEGVPRHLAGDEHGEFHGLRLALGLPRVGGGQEPGGREGEPGHRVGEAGLRLPLGLEAAFLHPAREARLLGLHGLLGGAHGLGARPGPAEVGVEQEGRRLARGAQ